MPSPDPRAARGRVGLAVRPAREGLAALLSALVLLGAVSARAGGGDVAARGPAVAGSEFGSATVAPVDLRDSTPRWIDVSFELSDGAPGRREDEWSPRLSAWLQPAALRHWAVISLPGPGVEHLLELGGERPEPGSFSDFVWILDTRSGHVVSAEVSGTLRTRVGWGFLSKEVQVDIQAIMSTERSLGFLPPSSLLGKEVFRSCAPGAEEGCTPVPPIPFRPASGYVNAPGEIRAAGAGVTTRTFSPLGEARFFEAPHRPRPVVASVEARAER